MPLPLPNLYCTPQDVYEQIGVDAAQLRLDDQNVGSGQQVIVTSTANIGDTTIAISALQYPLLLGSNLVFEQAGMSGPVEATLNAVANAAATSLTVVPLTSQIVAGAIATDNGVNVWLAGMLVKATKYATSRVKLYCCNRYNDSDLVNAWSVNRWATNLAAHWLSERLFRAAPAQIQRAYDETLEELKDVKASKINIEGIGTRTSGWPFLSNIGIDDRYTYRKLRVEQTTSELTPTQYPQAVDWGSIFYIEW